jgi:hypothetical protein
MHHRGRGQVPAELVPVPGQGPPGLRDVDELVEAFRKRGEAGSSFGRTMRVLRPGIEALM